MTIIVSEALTIIILSLLYRECGQRVLDSLILLINQETPYEL